MCIRDSDQADQAQQQPCYRRNHCDDKRSHHVSDHDQDHACLLYTSDAADERSSVDLGGRRIIKKKKRNKKKKKRSRSIHKQREHTSAQCHIVQLAELGSRAHTTEPNSHRMTLAGCEHGT